MIADTEACAELAASSWERMAAMCEEHRQAKAEYAAAELGLFLTGGPMAEVRLLCATVRLQRAEGRLR